MSYAFNTNDYGCFENTLLTLLYQYLTPKSLDGKNFLDITLGNKDDIITIFRNMKDLKVEYDKDEKTLIPITIQIHSDNTTLIFEKTTNGVYASVLIRKKDNLLKKPKIFIPTIIMFNN